MRYSDINESSVNQNRENFCVGNCPYGLTPRTSLISNKVLVWQNRQKHEIQYFYDPE